MDRFATSHRSPCEPTPTGSIAQERFAGLPAAVLTLTVSDPGWLAHLERGMIWDGFGFDDEAPVVI